MRSGGTSGPVEIRMMCRDSTWAHICFSSSRSCRGLTGHSVSSARFSHSSREQAHVWLRLETCTYCSSRADLLHQPIWSISEVDGQHLASLKRTTWWGILPSGNFAVSFTGPVYIASGKIDLTRKMPSEINYINLKTKIHSKIAD